MNLQRRPDFLAAERRLPVAGGFLIALGISMLFWGAVALVLFGL